MGFCPEQRTGARQYFQNLCRLQKTEVQINDLLELRRLPAGDVLEILLHKNLLHIEQFHLTLEPHIPVPEQILWHINAALPRPIENYYHAYQLYLQEETSCQGLFCVAPKEDLEAATVIANQKIKIYSADRQFLLFENKVNFWQIENFLQRIFNAGRIFCAAAAALCLLAGPELIWLKHRLAGQNAICRREKTALAAQLKKLKAQEREMNLRQKNKAVNQKLSEYLYAFSLNIPERVYLNELLYAEQELKLEGFCAQDKDLKALQKALKTASSLKPELARLNKDARINFTLRTELKKFLEKENVRLAQK
ncbi:MAG: hypothetical protein LBD99_05885 [Candidatus Margulisbacteria bacterium]|jgi:hypothetical protein|nr:hypothetical protein [Candidatus Margulisiibacteriota bacterium]